jgi:hypothetical protein
MMEVVRDEATARLPLTVTMAPFPCQREAVVYCDGETPVALEVDGVLYSIKRLASRRSLSLRWSRCLLTRISRCHAEPPAGA